METLKFKTVHVRAKSKREFSLQKWHTTLQQKCFKQIGAKATFQGCVIQERKIASADQAEEYHNCPICPNGLNSCPSGFKAIFCFSSNKTIAPCSPFTIAHPCPVIKYLVLQYEAQYFKEMKVEPRFFLQLYWGYLVLHCTMPCVLVLCEGAQGPGKVKL